MSRPENPGSDVLRAHNSGLTAQDLRLLLERSGAGLIIVDGKGFIQSLNSAAGTLFGYRPVELIAKPAAMLIPEATESTPSTRKQHVNFRDPSAVESRNPEMERGLAILGRHRDGHPLPLEIGLTSIETPSGTATLCYVLDATLNMTRAASSDALDPSQARRLEDSARGVPTSGPDVTDLPRAQAGLERSHAELEQQVAEQTSALSRQTEALAQANRDLAQFAHAISHDLRAPLRAINAIADWLANDRKPGDALSGDDLEHIGLLRGRVNRMNRMIEGLRAYLRIGNHAEAPTDVDLADLVASVIANVDAPAGMHFEVASQPPTVRTRKIALKSVLLNLIENAVKHHDREHGSIQVGMRPLEHGWIEFHVTDDGPGIAPEDREKIFRIFEVLQPRDQVEGSGMGLALAKRCVESQGGRLHVEPAEDRGSSFRFTWHLS